MGLKEELSLLQITTGNVECFIINIIVMNAQMSAIHHTSCTTIVVSTFEGSVTLVQQKKSKCLKLYTEGAVHGTENKSIPHLKPQTVNLLVVLSYHIVLALDLGFLPNEPCHVDLFVSGLKQINKNYWPKVNKLGEIDTHGLSKNPFYFGMDPINWGIHMHSYGNSLGRGQCSPRALLSFV